MIRLILNERNVEISSTSTGTLKQSISTRSEGSMRPLFRWQCDVDSFLDDTQIHGNNCSKNLNNSHKRKFGK